MKKIIAVILALALLCTVCGTLAEEPQFATFGDAVAAAGEEPVSGGTDEYMTVIVEKDGKFFRVVTMLDDEANWTRLSWRPRTSRPRSPRLTNTSGRCR